VVKAITTTKPVVVPLAGEPQGESVAFDPSGTHLFTVSDQEVSPVRTPILEYSLPVVASAGPPSVRPSSILSAEPGVAVTRTRRIVFALHPWTIAALAVGALLIVAGGVFASRRRRDAHS
jgi:LPXTG-motif cell wall-anchored protein